MKSNLIAALDSLVAGRHLLNHPFYQAWSAGRLTRESLQDYAIQYYRHVAAFPRYLSAIHSRCDDLATRQRLLENLIEEERGPRNHPELWIRFAEGLGASRDEVTRTAPRDCTRKLVDTYLQIARHQPIAAGLAALYVYESQMPAVAATKIDGLRRFYGISDDRCLAFFSVHREADVEHSRIGAALIDKLVTTADQRSATLSAGEAALGALWGMLDGMFYGEELSKSETRH